MTTTKRESYVSPAVDEKTVSLLYTALDYARLAPGFTVKSIAVDRLYGSFRVNTSAGHLVTLHAKRDWEPAFNRYVDSVVVAFFKGGDNGLCVASVEVDPDEFGVILATVMAFVNIPA